MSSAMPGHPYATGSLVVSDCFLFDLRFSDGAAGDRGVVGAVVLGDGIVPELVVRGDPPTIVEPSIDPELVRGSAMIAGSHVVAREEEVWSATV
jgi:hypothetical protein